MGNAAPRAAAATTPDAPERRLAEDLRHAVVVARLGRGRVLTSLRCRAGGAALVLKVHLPRARTKALDAARDEVARVRRRLADHPALAPAVASGLERARVRRDDLLVVSVSGGADSVALLRLLLALNGDDAAEWRLDLDPRTRAKFEMVTSNQALLDLFDRDQLPDTLGGTAAVQLPC